MFCCKPATFLHINLVDKKEEVERPLISLRFRLTRRRRKLPTMREDIVWPFTRKVPALRIFFWCCWKMFKGVVRSGPDMETWKIHENTAYASCYGWKNILKGFWRCFNIMWTIKALRYEWISLPRIRICLVTVWDWWTICSRRETSVVAVYTGNRGSRGFCRSFLRPCH